MRYSIRLLLFVAAAVFALPAAAFADVTHTVRRGETLTSVAAADGLSVARLAAANGLSIDAQLTAGSQIQIPPRGGPVEATSAASESSPPSTETAPSPSGSGGYTVRRGDTLSGIAARYGTSAAALAAANGMSVRGLLLAGRTLTVPGASAASSVSSEDVSGSESSSGGYLVRPGDTLSAIAARYGTSPTALAAANGMSVDGVLLAGRTLTVPGGSSAPTPAAPSPAGAQPVAEYVSPGDVGAIAAADGVPAALAEAIAEQESGFNDGEVSSSGAVGVMQIEPTTWNDLTRVDGLQLSPDSALDNVRGGVALLRSLLLATGENQHETIAAYYQGLESVRSRGMLPSTRHYVRDVLALESRFGA
jgi:N-acetylmuramoyl-L-alanine amidase